jgi:hypothetical protein
VKSHLSGVFNNDIFVSRNFGIQYVRAAETRANGRSQQNCAVIAYPIISLPILVVTNRDIVRPYRRLTTNPVTSFRLPLTPQERRRPWLLYSIPGLFVTQMVTTGLFALEKNLSHRYFPDTSQGNPTSMNYWRVAVPRMVLLAAVMTPFNVIATRCVGVIYLSVD